MGCSDSSQLFLANAMKRAVITPAPFGLTSILTDAALPPLSIHEGIDPIRAEVAVSFDRGSALPREGVAGITFDAVAGGIDRHMCSLGRASHGDLAGALRSSGSEQCPC